MPLSRKHLARLSHLAFAPLLVALATGAARAQVPTLPGGQMPSAAQVQTMLQTQPELVVKLRQKLAESGLSPDQVRARLRAAGYPESLLDPYMTGGDSTQVAAPGSDVFDAVRILGIVGSEEAESLLVLTDSARAVADSLRADSLAQVATGLQVFGLDLFHRATNLFQAAQNGPVDANYRLGPGDALVLILTGEVELAYDLDVNREGFVVIPQVGQINVANLTLGQLEDLLYARLGRVYSGVRRGPGATTKFSVTVSRLRTIQVSVVGDVTWPGSYQISGAGTVLSALYAAGGPTTNGTFRRIEVRRGGRLADSLDIYDYLLHGDNSHDIRLETGDVVFVPVREERVQITGSIIRPAIYELRPTETLRDLILFSGGFTATAARQRVQIYRVLPPEQRRPDGYDRVVLEISSDQFADGLGPPFLMAPGDSVTAFWVTTAVRQVVRVSGNVWTPGEIGLTQGMKLSEVIRLAGGPKPDTYRDQILISRLLPDSSRIQLRSAFRDSSGAVTEDLILQEYDEITVFSLTNFRPERYVVITGAVRSPGRISYLEGVTLRDALLQVNGVTQDADLRQAEIARLPSETERADGQVAATLEVALDSTYLFERAGNGPYLGPPGLQVPAQGAPEILLKPYDNVLILRQPDWELQRTVTITGQVRFPGHYALKTKTDRLLDMINRAGGLTKEAYAAGIQLTRVLGREGRIGVDLPKVLKDSTFRDNLILVGGDSINIPEFNPVVFVRGAVNAAVSAVYVPGQNTDFYIGAAGGFTQTADKGGTYVTQPSGKVQSVKRRFLLPDDKPLPLPGAVVFVPEKPPETKQDLAVIGIIASVLASVTAMLVALTKL